MNAKQDTPEGDLLDVLITLVEAYETHSLPLEDAHPVKAIKFYMEQNVCRPKETS